TGNCVATLGICESGLSTDNDAIDACITTSCCDSFNVCLGTPSCERCLTTSPQPSGCSFHTLFEAYSTCEETHCETEICDSNITFSDTSGNPRFECIQCANTMTAGCAALQVCVGDGTTSGTSDC